jgi:hypothetical protein
MAKLKGLLKIEGTLDDVTFFKRNDSYFVRNKGGVSKERILNDPAFARTRENGTEFAQIAIDGKLLRNSSNSLCRKAYDGTLNNRLMKTFAEIKNLDTTSARGYRTVSNGLNTVEGKQLLKNYNFNNRSHMSSVLFAPYVLDTTTGKVEINGLIPLDMLKFPTHATHVSFQSGFLNLDLQTGVSDISYSPITNLALDMTASTVILAPTDVPGGSGFQFYFLLIEFFQEINRSQYALNNGSYNVLNLLEVL